MVKFLIFLALLSGCFSPLEPVTVNTTACQIKFELRSTKYWKASELASKLAASSQDEILAAGQSIFEVFMKYLEFEKHKDIFSRADLYPRPFSESEKSKVKKTYASEPAKIFLAQQAFIMLGGNFLPTADTMAMHDDGITFFKWLSKRLNDSENIFIGNPPEICP